MHSKTNQRLLPAGCDQQGRYATRERGAKHEHWADAEYVDTIIVPEHSYAASQIPEPPLDWGGFVIAAAVVGFIAWVVSNSPAMQGLWL